VKVARESVRITGSGCVNQPVWIRSNDLQTPHEAPCVSEGGSSPSEILMKIKFEWYCNVVKELTDDPRINLHIVNKEGFKELEKIYFPRIKIL